MGDQWLDNQCSDVDRDPCHDEHRVAHHVESYGSDGLALVVGWLLWREYRRYRAKTAPPSPAEPTGGISWFALGLVVIALILAAVYG